MQTSHDAAKTAGDRERSGTRPPLPWSYCVRIAQRVALSMTCSARAAE